MQLEKFYYDNRIVKNFAYATIIWGGVGMLVGLWVALATCFSINLISLNMEVLDDYDHYIPMQ